MSNTISINDIKFDLLKMIESWDGILMQNQWKPIFNLFDAYLRDLKDAGTIREYNVIYSVRENSITYDVNVKISNERSPKKLKIHVGTFQHPWISKTENA
jgi:hypothetical protein